MGFNPNGSDSGYVAIENLCIPDGIHYPELLIGQVQAITLIVIGDTVAFEVQRN